ncbi:hypothetical protein FBY03_104172 [Pseudomonas sp. SJZ079]|uniref:hypothetical protein n=1 Tax=Pseudomonas sp. SJZ079 TaxID=2572887 RepID=UPI00119A19BE|nr:hypothetical protein [Pseudomonas sp. SJZ079]TWC39621.1 hypothetical protein FBY03_104172 [Pseudomonas sp. SJZ079]
MKGWLSLALASAGLAVGVSIWLLPTISAPPVTVVVSPPAPPQSLVAPHLAAKKPLTTRPAPAPLKPDDALAVPTAYSVAEAQMLIQLMAEQGDPRQPALGQLQARTGASAAQLADPQQYAAFADQQERALVQVWASGVQQIPSIRARIEQAAQSGERSAVEIDEARAALEQLQHLHSRLQRESPELLPNGDSGVAPPSASH